MSAGFMQDVSRPVRRFAALGLLVAVLVGGVAFVALPIMDAFERQRAAIEDASRRLTALEASVARQDRVAEELDALRRDVRASGLFLPAASDGIAGAELQSRLQRLLQIQGCEVSSARALPPQDDPFARPVAVSVGFRCDQDAAHRALNDIETQLPLLVIQGARLRRLAMAPGALEDGRKQRLEATIEAAGFMLAGGVAAELEAAAQGARGPTGDVDRGEEGR